VPQAVVHVEHNIIGYQGRRRLVLVVDDHLQHRQILAGMLEPLGFQVIQAANGQEAVRLTALHNPDLILMDLAMPLLDGWQTSHLIRRNVLSQAPIIVVSANAFADDRERSIEAECNDYLAKPVYVPALLDKIKTHLQLEWLKRPEPLTGPAAPLIAPSIEALNALYELGAEGYVKGILEKLDWLEQQEPLSASYLQSLRSQVKRFQLNDFNRRLEDAMLHAGLTVSTQ
jgi:CheY-like chemotaxis protein